jgi:hypothetical protein
VESIDRAKSDAFRCKLKEDWGLLWKERFDDKIKAEGVSVKDYPLLFVDRGHVIFASRDAKTPSFSEIVEFWASQGCVYTPDPVTGGWGKFARTYLAKRSQRRRVWESSERSNGGCVRQHLKKGGRGWLHK